MEIRNGKKIKITNGNKIKYFPWPGWWMVQAGAPDPPLVFPNLGYCWSMCFGFEPLPVCQKKYKGNTKET